MNIQHLPSPLRGRHPLPPPGPPDPPTPAVVDQIGAVQLGSFLSDVGMAGAYQWGSSAAISGLGWGLAVAHAARGAAFAASALNSSGMKLQHRLGVVASEGLLAAGHAAGALGHGLASLPLLLGGSTLNAVMDYRYRNHFGVTTPENGQVAGWRKGVAAVDLTLGAGYALGVPATAGFVAGAAHLGATLGYYGGSLAKPEMKHHWHSKGFGHALLAAGHLATAAGAGPWALPVLAGGTLITTLQDARQG
jgi:hypothetical protein